MEKMLDRIEERGYSKGEARGLQQGRQQGLQQGRQQEREDNISSMADYFQKEHPEMTREQAAELAASILR